MAEINTLQAAAYTAFGTAREPIGLPPELFDGTVNMPVMHRAVKAHLANQREGNASTKTRGLVIGGNQKPWKQKGTGRARAGSTRSPLWPGGGTVFGPTPRSYDEKLPRKMRALARKSAFNARALENAILIIDRFAYEAPRTKLLIGLLERLGIRGLKALVLTDGIKSNVYLSGRNLPNVHVMPYSDVSTYELLWSDAVLIEATAIGQTLAPVAETEATPTPRNERSVSGTEGKGEAPKKSRSAAKATTKTATKKAVARKAAKSGVRKTSPAATPAKKTTSKGGASKGRAPKKKGK